MEPQGRDWSSQPLCSPVSGHTLTPRGRSVLAADDEVWPVVEDIPFLRADRIEMARAAVAMIEADDLAGATALLLTDQDPYAPDAPPSVDACLELVRDEARFTLRDAMAHLGFGRVGDYFAHRWSDPTYLSGLALLGAAGFEGPLLELACGIGHFIRAASLAGTETAGADLVFAKLWLARRFVCARARLICFDAASPWPLADGSFPGAFCHDALYFMPDKPAVMAQMRRIVGVSGCVAIGHAHNASADNHSSGAPLTVEGYAALLPDAELFDDRELTRAFADGREPVPAQAATLAGAQAISMIWQRNNPAARRGFGTDAESRRLRLNPLYRREGGVAHVVWPSRRYEQEYAELATYPSRWEGPDELEADSAAAAELLRNRTYVDLPPRW